MAAKNPKWKQKNPNDQLVVLRNDIWGNLENLKDNIIDKDEFYRRTLSLLNEMEALEAFLKQPDLWDQGFIAELTVKSTQFNFETYVLCEDGQWYTESYVQLPNAKEHKPYVAKLFATKEPIADYPSLNDIITFTRIQHEKARSLEL